jgi:uncharacterized protein (DUF4415 family)
MKAESKARWAEARRRARASLREISDEEDAAITKAARSDPDAPELSGAWYARSRRLSPAEVKRIAAAFRRGPGRPKAETKKVSVTIRLDPDVLAALKAQGPGWQTRVNDLLARWVKRRRRAA